MNATSATEFGRGVYGYEMNRLEAIMNYREHTIADGRIVVTERQIPVHINWVGIRSAGRTGYYIVYFDGVDDTNMPPDVYRVDGKKSQYRADGIMMFRVGKYGLKKVIQNMVEQ